MMLSVPLNQAAIQQRVLGSEPPTGKHKPAGLPVSNPTRSFWADSPNANPMAREGSEGLLTGDVDVCIIGSGITGVSSAYHLSKALEGRSDGVSLKAVILDAREFCSGATGRNGGHIRPNPFFDFCTEVAKYGIDQVLRSLAIEHYTASEIRKILGSEGLADSVDFVSECCNNLLFSEQNIKDTEADFFAAKVAGVDLSHVEWLSKEDMKARYGTCYPAVRFPSDNIWPLKLVTHLYNLAKATTPLFSLTLHTCTPVTSIAPLDFTSTPSRRWALTTPRGIINCSYVIHATNAHASHLLPHMCGPEGIIPVRGQVMATRANATLRELTRSSWSANEGFEYWFPRPVMNPAIDKPLIILGGGREAGVPKFEVYVEDDSVVSEVVGKVLREFLPSVFPGKFEQGREPEMEWTGIMGFTKVGHPFVGPVLDPDGDHKGQFIAAGYNGHGMTRAFACAEVVGKMVIAEHTGDVWIQPEWLPDHFLTWMRNGNFAGKD